MSDVLINREVIDKINESDINNLGAYAMTAHPFRPVRCLQSDLDNKIKPVNGFVYFTLDTQKIYYGTDSEFLPMGGSSGIFYATKTFDVNASDDMSFSADNFADGQLPNNINDLIINVGNNIARNGFYKVIAILADGNTVITEYLPVGGGGGTAGTTDGGKVLINYIYPSSSDCGTIKFKDKCEITYELTIMDAAGDELQNNGKATWYINNIAYDGGIVKPGLNKFDVGPYLSSHTTGGLNKINLVITADTNGSVQSTGRKSWEAIVMVLDLVWKFPYSYESYVNSERFELAWTPMGNQDTITQIWFDNINNPSNGVTFKVPKSLMGQEKREWFNAADFNLDYGVHEIYMQLLTADGKYSTKILKNYLTVITNGAGPILTVPTTLTNCMQYDTIKIPFLVYDPQEEQVEVEFLVDGIPLSSRKYGRELQEDSITYTPGVSGTVLLGLRVVGSEIAWESEISVLPLDLGIVEPTPDFKLKASDLVGQDNLRQLESDGILSFSENFDWINGGLKTEIDEKGHIRKYILIKNGTTMTIKRTPFAQNAINNGKSLKVIFKATNCYDYDAQVLSCNANPCNFVIKAQEASFTAPDINILTKFYENSYIELELDIWKKDTVGVTYVNPLTQEKTQVYDNYVLFWVDGVPSIVDTYEHSTTSIAQNNPQYITVGSNDCDVQLYLFKYYERELSHGRSGRSYGYNSNEHLDNFILDAPNAEEMIDRFNRNDILDMNGDISYTKLVEKNPGCHAFIYDIERMTKNKNDKIGGCYYEHYYSDPRAPQETAQNVVIKVQGTSSAAYGVAAYNIDSSFEDGFIDAKGNVLEGWSMSESSIPINYFCTKVNVASCENANNALNQEWYNRFQPYWDGHRRASRTDGKLARDCMEFIPGVLFMKDRNANRTGDNDTRNLFWDSDLYMGIPANDRGYLQYAICNMGNSKKNGEVFHSPATQNNKVSCVEVRSNNNPEHEMTVYNPEAFDKRYYEFRFPDEKNFDYSSRKNDFFRLVEWFADNNPKAATGEKLSSEETYSAYTFKGFNPPGYDSNSGSGITLAGLRDSTYEGTYTHDTYERRMAKMLNECENYLVMDSIVYHYLFIERHAMVDNVAKNTFWSTEDGEHWDLTKNYDNDTADGNDNSGNMNFTYGIEVGDIIDGASAFNAPNSVWLNFIQGLPNVREDLYRKLASTGAWDAAPYLQAFKEFQKVIPERCWIYDYFRKYIRPRQIARDINSFLSRLEGGQKTHQRAQYENYQDIYQNSKYGVYNTQQNIDMRLYADSIPDNAIIPITYYTDCYANTLIGENSYRERYKRGSTYNLNINKMFANNNASLTDATCYFYFPELIQYLGDVSFLKPKYFAGSNAARLRTALIGSDKEGYFSEKVDKEGMQFRQNSMLEELNLQNVGIQDILGTISLENSVNLQKLYIDGSGVSGIVLAKGGELTEAKFNDLTSLVAEDLIYLDKDKVNFEYDRNNDGFYRFSSLNVKNCPTIDTYNLTLKSPNLNSYYLTDVNWEITNIEDLTIVNNSLSSIKVLEHLLKQEYNEATNSYIYIRQPLGETPALSLTGTLTINVEVNVDEFVIYDKYNKIFPNLKIQYNIEKVKFTPAAAVTFYQTDEPDAKILSTILIPASGSTKPLGELISKEATGIEFNMPYKESTQQTKYYWNISELDKDWGSNIEGSYNEYTDNEMKQLIPNAAALSRINATIMPDGISRKNIEFTPVFTAESRMYNIVLRDIDENGNSFDITHEYYHSAFGAIIPLPTFLYKEHPDTTKRWSFKGWISPADHLTGTNSPTLLYTPIDNLLEVTGDFYAYAFYVEEDCATVPTDLNYFNFNGPIDKGAQGVGYEISIKDEYRNVLRGKITLPAKYNDQFVISAANFRNMPLITHVYFETGNNYTRIENYAFACDNSKITPALKAVYLPSSIQIIGSYAFYEQVELLDANLDNLINLLQIGGHAFRVQNRTGTMKIKCSKLPDTITSIGHSAFYKGGENITITKLPANLLSLSDWSFHQCPNIAITEFGSDTLPGLTSIGSQTFSNSGVSVMGNIYIKASITALHNVAGAGPFENYGSNITAVLAYPSTEYNDGIGITAAGIGVSKLKSADKEEVTD